MWGSPSDSREGQAKNPKAICQPRVCYGSIGGKITRVLEMHFEKHVLVMM